MSIESLHPEAYTPPVFQNEFVPVVVQEGDQQYRDETDHTIEQTLTEARSQIILAKKAIEIGSQLLLDGMTEERFKVKAQAGQDANTVIDKAAGYIEEVEEHFEKRKAEIEAEEREARALAKGDRIIAIEERDRQIQAIEEQHRQIMRSIDRRESSRVLDLSIDLTNEQVDKQEKTDATITERDRYLEIITEQENSAIAGYDETEEEGLKFYEACWAAADAMLEGARMYREAHAGVVSAIRQSHENLANAELELAASSEMIQQITADREELLAEHDAIKQIVADLRKDLVRITRRLQDETNEEYVRRQGITHDDSVTTPEDINEVYAQDEAGSFAYHQDHVKVLNERTSVEEEIKTRVAEIMELDKEIARLKDLKVAYEYNCEQLVIQIAAYKQEPAQLEVMKQKIARTAGQLQQRGDALDTILRNSFDALDTIPLELRELIEPAIKAGFIKGKQEKAVDLTTAIPDMNRPAFNVSATIDELEVTHYAGPQTRAASIESDDEVSIEEARKTSREIIRTLREDVEGAISWVRENAGTILPEAALLVERGLTKPGMTVRVRAHSNE